MDGATVPALATTASGVVAGAAYLSRRVQVAPLLAVGFCLYVGAAVASDVVRFWAHDPVPSLVLAWCAVAGLLVGASKVDRSWLGALCEAWLLGGGLTLAVFIVAMLIRPVSGSTTANTDVMQLSIVAFTFVAVVLAARHLFGGNERLRRLGVLIMGVRLLTWLCGAAATSLGWGPGETLADMLVWAFVLLHVVMAVVMAVGGWRPTTRRRRLAPLRAAYVVATVVLLLLLVVLPLRDQAQRGTVLVLAGGTVAALLLRQILTTRELEASIEQARRREDFFRTVVQDSRDVVLICDAEGHLDYVSPSADRVLLAREEGSRRRARSRSVGDVLGCPDDVVVDALARAAQDGEARFEVQTAAQSLEASVARREQGFVVSVRDVTERSALRERLHTLAYNDILTGLPNRRQLIDQLTAMLAAAPRSDQIAVLFLDLDRFKQVNDSSGHGAGDELLREIASRLSGIKGPTRLLARLGGDEFVMVVGTGSADAVALARRVHRAVRQPVVVQDQVHQVGASIGIAVADPGVRPEELVQRADLAMYTAKHSQAAWLVYDAAMGEAVRERAEADRAIARVWGPDAVRVHLQPIVRVEDLGVHSAEALLRWAQDGLVRGPGPVLEYAVRTGQLASLTGWILGEVLRRKKVYGHGGAPIAVNLPPSVLHIPDAVDRLAAAIARAGLTPADLHLELTEDALIAGDVATERALHALRGHGFRLYVDDFGTGYSSLSYLVKLPVDGIKIDRSFVQALPHSTAARSIVSSVGAFARDLGVALVAEGVETPEEDAWVRELRVPLVQGFLYARPHDGTLLSTASDLREWGDSRGSAGRRTTPEPFALGGAEC